MTTGDEWKTEEETMILTPEMARRFAEARTLFLLEAKGKMGIVEATIGQVSPNNLYARVTVEGSGQGWIPVTDIKVLDVLKPMQEKQVRQRPQALEELMNGLILEQLASAANTAKPRPPKKKKEDDDGTGTKN